MILLPGLDAAFLHIVDPRTARDPDRQGVLWTNLSWSKVAEELKKRGFRVGVGVNAHDPRMTHLDRRFPIILFLLPIRL